MTVRSGVVAMWILATGVIIACLYLGRSILAPFAMAVFLFLVMEGFQRLIKDRVSFMSEGMSRAVAIFGVLLGFGLFIALLARGIAQFGEQASDYEEKINGLIGDAYGMLQLGQAPTLTEIMFDERGQRFFATIASAMGDLSGDLVIILIYIAFLFLAQSAWSPKLDRIFTERAQREQVREVGGEEPLDLASGDLVERPQLGDHPGQDDDGEERVVRSADPGVAERLDLVPRRRQAHGAPTVQGAVAVDVPLREGEAELGLQGGHDDYLARSRRSWVMVSSSIMTSSVPASRSEADQRDGQPARKFQRSTSVPVES